MPFVSGAKCTFSSPRYTYTVTLKFTFILLLQPYVYHDVKMADDVWTETPASARPFSQGTTARGSLFGTYWKAPKFEAGPTERFKE